MRIRAVVWSVGMQQGTDRQMATTNIHFASATPHVKCNDAMFTFLLIWCFSHKE